MANMKLLGHRVSLPPSNSSRHGMFVCRKTNSNIHVQLRTDVLHIEGLHMSFPDESSSWPVPARPLGRRLLNQSCCLRYRRHRLGILISRWQQTNDLLLCATADGAELPHLVRVLALRHIVCDWPKEIAGLLARASWQ